MQYFVASWFYDVVNTEMFFEERMDFCEQQAVWYEFGRSSIRGLPLWYSDTNKWWKG